MNRPIRTMAIFCLLLFLALMGQATYIQYVQASDLNAHADNRRVIVAAFSRQRGAILVRREPIADSVPSEDRYQWQRTYPQPETYAHLTGYFSYFSQTAVERSQNAVLSGDDSRLFVTRLVDLLTNAEPTGGSVELTIDPAAQQAAFDGLRALGGGTEGAVVALEPTTGRILAMVSAPTYDPNRLASHDLNQVNRAYAELDGDESEPLLNRGIQTTLPPGSTFKLVTASAALESGDYDPESEVPGGASFDLPDSTATVGNSGGGDCGGEQITLTQALTVSCNVSFLSLANELGTEAMREQAEAFGFNSDYLEDLPLQAQSRYPADLDRPQTALSGIGQSEVAATPLQMAMVAAGIANGGTVMRPYVVERVRSPDLDIIDQTDPSELSEAVSSTTADQVTQMMVETVRSGTASSAAISGVDVAGKTGTAESAGDRPPYAWFVSFAPADDPQVAVAVVVESSETSPTEISGGRLAGPIARSVIEAVISR